MDDMSAIDALYSLHPVVLPEAIYDVQNCSQQFLCANVGSEKWLLRHSEKVHGRLFQDQLLNSD